MARKKHEPDLATLAGRVAFARGERKLTQDQVAVAVGITQPTFSKIERGDIKEPWGILALAHALECNPYWLERGPELGGDWDAVPTFQKVSGAAEPDFLVRSSVETLSRILVAKPEASREVVSKRFNDLATSPDSAIAKSALIKSLLGGDEGLGGMSRRESALPPTGSDK